MSGRFRLIDTDLDDVKVVRRTVDLDNRGAFCRLYCSREVGDLGLQMEVVQVNHSVTRQKGSIRGMHYQLPPCAEAKLVTCIKGSVFDVAVDLRRGSRTFLKWVGVELSDDSALYIPEGFGHGFQTLTDNCELVYFHSAAYSPAHERGISVFDPIVGIAWPLEAAEMSKRDREREFMPLSGEGVDLFS